MSSYNFIAAEYYSARHTTCRNFDDTTRANLLHVTYAPKPVIEFGAGRGRCLEYTDVEADVQVDSSVEMLRLQPREPGLRVLSDATKTPFLDDTFGTAFAFLCDPYVGLAFFVEAYRVLRPESHLIFTVPSYEWGTAFRGGEKHEAKFTTNDGYSVLVPSVLHTLAQLRKLLELTKFRLLYSESYCLPRAYAPSTTLLSAAAKLDVDVYALPLLYIVGASK